MIEIDLHIHSKYSDDSLLGPCTIIRKAKSKGISVIAVVDHNTIVGALETSKEASVEDILVVPGIEVRTNLGDLIGLFVKEQIDSRDFCEAVDAIKGQNGLVVLPHPLRGHPKISREMMNDIDLVEALNGRTPHRENIQATELALSYGKPVISGSDAHFTFELGCVRTILSGVSSSLEELRRSLVKNDRTLVGKESTPIVHVLSFGVQKIRRAVSKVSS